MHEYIKVKGFRLHVTRVITLIVALQIVNLGLFAQDFQPLETSAVTPEINIINSIDEYVAEIVFHHKDAVPENNKHLQKDLQMHKHTIYKLIGISKSQTLSDTRLTYYDKHSLLIKDYNYLFCKNIYSPPPKL